jgi:hypothetical protein
MISETKLAPDADQHKARTIGLYYCPNEQGHVAYLDEYLGPGEEKRTRIMRMRDGESNNYPKELETLLSWGEIMDSHPVRGAWHGMGFGRREYRLHDTPMVRKLLQVMDGDHCARLAEELIRIIKEAHDSGYTIGKWSPGQDYEWTDLPKDICTRIYKTHGTK